MTVPAGAGCLETPQGGRSYTPGLLAGVLSGARVGDVTVLAALAWWATWLTWGAGGRDPRVQSVSAGLVGVALLTAPGWRRLPAVAIVLPVSVMVAVWAVVGTAPTGYGGANEAASYAVAAVLFLVVAGWAQDSARRLLVVGVVVAACGAEFAQAFLPWWGSGTPTHLMWGTFYWHNQYAAFLLPGAVLGLAGVVSKTRPLSTLGWVVMPLSVAGVLFSTSRGGEIAAALGVVAVLALTPVVYGRRRVLRGVLAVAVSIGVSVVLTGPPFFAHRVSIVSGTAARASSLRGNGTARLEDWQRALAVWRHWPVTGAGFHSFGAASDKVTTHHDSNLTAYVHNGFLQALSDGGLVLGLPFLLACLLVAFLALRQVVRTVRARGEFLSGALAAAVVVVMLHSGMDFDWAYASLLDLFAILAAALVATGGLRVRRRAWPCHLVTVVLLAGLTASAVAAWHGNWHLTLPV